MTNPAPADLPDAPSMDAPALRSDAVKNRAALLAAAAEEYAAGDGSLRMHAIARRAGVGVGTMYRHFPTRDDLAEALALNQLEQLVEIAENTTETTDTRDALRVFLLDTLRLNCDPMFTRLLLSPGRRSAQTEGLIGRFARAVARLVEVLRAEGQLRADVSADDVVVMLHGAQVAAREAGNISGLAEVYSSVLARGLAASDG